MAEDAVSHLSSRISNNGLTFGPSIEFLDWLSRTPVSQVGAVPRFAVLRWALGEDPDLWLPLRGRVSRNFLVLGVTRMPVRIRLALRGEPCVLTASALTPAILSISRQRHSLLSDSMLQLASSEPSCPWPL